MAAVNGTKILVKVGTKVITGITTASLKSVMDAIEVTTKLSTGGAKEFIGGELNRTITASGLWDPDDTTNYGYLDALTAQEARTPVAFIYGGVASGDDIITGNAIITDISRDDPQNAKSTFSISLQVTGAIVQSTVTP